MPVAEELGVGCVTMDSSTPVPSGGAREWLVELSQVRRAGWASFPALVTSNSETGPYAIIAFRSANYLPMAGAFYVAPSLANPFDTCFACLTCVLTEVSVHPGRQRILTTQLHIALFI